MLKAGFDIGGTKCAAVLGVWMSPEISPFWAG